MAKKNFVGIGFGPIQSALFLLEAFESGHFDSLVVAEVDPNVVGAVRRSGGTYRINVAEPDRIDSQMVEGLEILNPAETCDQGQLVTAIASADEIATALPSVDFYGRGSPSPGALLAAGIEQRLLAKTIRPLVIYAAENHNHAAERLRDLVHSHLPSVASDGLDIHVQFVNTVIGKMSGVVTGPDQIEQSGLQMLTESAGPAVLVEQFNRILIETITLPDFEPGLTVFQQREDLLPFEEAKLYGHNAAHALMGYLAHLRGLQFMSDVRKDDLRRIVEQGFLVESGKPLCERHHGVDKLFTESGWKAYVQDLLHRMTNPYLRDRVDRVIRDPQRKLGWNDRLIGTMRMAMQYGVEPHNYAMGAAAAVQLLLDQRATENLVTLLHELWGGDEGTTDLHDPVISLIRQALGTIERSPRRP
ncbi:MAG: hypothetical protein MK171_08225 [Pirellulales bacterium]|nr:hypothetical protein [Pirellulales bacterium]